MQTKFCFQYLYGPCCHEMGSLFWIWWKFLVLLEKSASWNIHTLCVQQAAFSISSVKSSWLQRVLQKPTHSCKWGMTQVWILQMELQIWGQGTKLEASEDMVHLLQVSVRSPSLNLVTLYSNKIRDLCRQALQTALFPLSGNCFSWCRLMDFQ